MAIDPSIPLGIRPQQPVALPAITSPLDRYQKMLTLRHLMTQGQLGTLNLEQTRLENEALGAKQQRITGISNLLQGGKRPEDAELLAFGPEGAAALKALYDSDKSRYDAWEATTKAMTSAAQGIAALPEDQQDFAYRAARSRFVAANPAMAQVLPEQFQGKAWIQSQIDAGLTAQQYGEKLRADAEEARKKAEAPYKLSETKAKSLGEQLVVAAQTAPNNQSEWTAWRADLSPELQKRIPAMFSPIALQQVQMMGVKQEVGKTLAYPAPVQTQREAEWRMRLEQQNDPLGLFKTAPAPTPTTVTPAPSGSAPPGSTPAVEVSAPGQEPKMIWFGPDGTKYHKPPPVAAAPAPTAAARPRYSPELVGADVLPTLPGPVAQQVKAIAEGRMAIPSGQGLRTPYWQQMMTLVGQYDPSFDVNNPGKRLATAKDFASGKAAQQVNALNTVIGHLESLSTATDAMGNTWSPAFNSVKNWLSVNAGHPEVKAFEATKKAVVDELTRVWRGTGGSEGDIKTWSASLDAANSPQQLHAVIAQIGDLLNSKLTALQDQYREGMGTIAEGRELLSPKSREALSRLERKTGGGQNKPTVKMKAPNGQVSDVPADQVEHYKSKGAVVIGN